MRETLSYYDSCASQVYVNSHRYFGRLLTLNKERIHRLLKEWLGRQQRCSMQEDVLRNFTKFTAKHMCQSLSFNKVAGQRSATLLKKKLWHRHFPVNFAKFLRTPFMQNTSGRVLLEWHVFWNDIFLALVFYYLSLCWLIYRWSCGCLLPSSLRFQFS